MRIAIGPLSNPNGASGRIAKTLIHYSKNEIKPFTPPYYNKFVMRIWQKTGIKFYDPYGFYLSHYSFNNFDIVQYINHPLYREVHFRPEQTTTKFVYRVPGIYRTYIDSNIPHSSIYYKLDEWMFESCRNCDAVISPNEWFKSYLRDNCGIDSILIKNGIAAKKWLVGNKKRFEENYGISPGFILYAGRLSKEKGPDFFVELAESLPEEKFVMIGPMVTSSNVSKFVGKKLPDNLFCLGRLNGYDLVDCFSSSNILINPALSKFGGNVILEAMASNTIPIVSVEYSENRNQGLWFEDFVEGLTFSNNDLEDCIAKINYAKKNKHIGLLGQKRILSEYDWEHKVKEYDELYSSLV